MPSIGILLPGSTLYPSIGIDFLQGIKSCFKQHFFSIDDFFITPIGFGLNAEEVRKETEKMLLTHNPDLVVIYGRDILAENISRLVDASGKMLIIANAGANYPEENYKGSSLIFHTLNDCLCSYITGQLAFQGTNNKAVLATSFYDGGYQHVHALVNGFNLSGGENVFNYISNHKKELFNTDSLEDFFAANPDVKKILAAFCGDMARLFFEKIKHFREKNGIEVYGSPMIFDSSPGDFSPAKQDIRNVQGYVSWLPELENDANREFISFYQKENAKEANLFSMHGWELGLIIKEFFTERKATDTNQAAISSLQTRTITSPRGNISLTDSQYISTPVYKVRADGENRNIEDSIPDTSALRKEMVAQIPGTPFTSWKNTYLCI